MGLQFQIIIDAVHHGKTAESHTNILETCLIYDYELKWGFGGLPLIIMLICVNWLDIIQDASPNIA